MTFMKRLFNSGHTLEFKIEDANDLGWEVREEEDDRIVKRAWLHDWRRVEQTMTLFSVRAGRLEQAGWVEI